MIETLKRLLSPEYLVVSEPGPLGGLWASLAVIALGFIAGITLSARVLLGPEPQSRAREKRALAWFELGTCAAGLAAIAGRALGWPGWSARIWPILFLALSAAGLAGYFLGDKQIPRWLGTQLRILALAPVPHEQDQRHRRPAVHIALAGLHVAGIAIVAHGRYSLPLWTAPLLMLALLVPQFPLLTRRRPPQMAALTPLFGAYAAELLALLYQELGITIIGWQGLVLPNPFVTAFYTDGIILAAVIYALLCQTAWSASATNRPARRWRWTLAGLVVATLVWSGIVYLSKRTHGVTASDPYAYTQMGIDLANNGTFLHRFDLFQKISSLGIPWSPLQPVGYHVPVNEYGDSPSVWATGFSVLLAFGYRLFGETGAYLTSPVIALLSLVAIWFLVQETLRTRSRPVRYLTAGITIALVATSTEQVDRLLVPMADAAAQLFTVLTLLFVLRSQRLLCRGGLPALLSVALTGLCLGWAYWVRHTQLVLFLAIVVAIAFGVRGRPQPFRRTLNALLVVSLFAVLAAAPDIWYRWRVFGSPWAVESTELASMGLVHVGTVSRQLLGDLLAAGEWGYLVPLAVFGAAQLAMNRRVQAVVLGLAFVAIVLLHLTYQFLRLRDLLSIFPVLALCVAYGAVLLAHEAGILARGAFRRDRLGPVLLGSAYMSFIIFSLALARWAIIDRVWKPGWASFGYVNPDMRLAMDRLAYLTPPDAVVACSLNAGAVALHSDRDSVRPYDTWTASNWATFVDAMKMLGRDIYLLDDGKQMSTFIDTVRASYRLEPVEFLRVPIFGAPDRTRGWLYRLEWQP